jgi:hypothetical protein
MYACIILHEHLRMPLVKEETFFQGHDITFAGVYLFWGT